MAAPLAVTQPSTKPGSPRCCLPSQTIPIFQPPAHSLPSFPLKTSGFWKQFNCELQRGLLGQCWPAGGPALPKCFISPQGSHTRDLADPAPIGSLPSWEREAPLLPSKPFNWRKKNNNNKYQSKGFLPFEGQEGEQPGEGRTCQEQSRDPYPPGLEREHFHYELLQRQNEALGASVALKFKSGCFSVEMQDKEGRV